MKRASRVLWWMVPMAFVWTLSACAPEALTTDPDAGDASGTDNGQDSGSTTPDIVEADTHEPALEPTFPVIAQIIRDASCAISACHGGDNAGNLVIDGTTAGNPSTNEQIRAGLEGVIASNDIPIVTPGEPEQSELYLRLINPDPDIRMPNFPLEALSQDKIDLVRDWISDGAPFEEPEDE